MALPQVSLQAQPWREPGASQPHSAPAARGGGSADTVQAPRSSLAGSVPGRKAVEQQAPAVTPGHCALGICSTGVRRAEDKANHSGNPAGMALGAGEGPPVPGKRLPSPASL